MKPAHAFCACASLPVVRGPVTGERVRFAMAKVLERAGATALAGQVLIEQHQLRLLT